MGNAPAVAAARGAGGIGSTANPHCADAAQAKQIANLAARAALFGAVLHAIRDDRGRRQWVLHHGPVVKGFSTLAGLAEHLDALGGPV
jgi:hypothetical protein